jgi:hypothetical protein
MMVTAKVTLTALFFISGCRQGQQEVAPPPIDVENSLRPGMSPAEVERLLGKPDRRTDYNARDKLVLQSWEYRSWGLRLTFHVEKGLGSIAIEKRWSRAVHGFKRDDPLENLAKGADGRSPLELPIQNGHWPRAYCQVLCFSTEQHGQPTEACKVGDIVFKDDNILGRWLLRLHGL